MLQHYLANLNPHEGLIIKDKINQIYEKKDDYSVFLPEEIRICLAGVLLACCNGVTCDDYPGIRERQ